MICASAKKVNSRHWTFVKKYLQNEGLKIEASDLGGHIPRRIHFFPTTGKVDRLLLRRMEDTAVFKEELVFKSQLEETEQDGGTVLFGEEV